MTENSPQTNNKWKNKLIVGLVIILILVIATAAYALSKNKDEAPKIELLTLNKIVKTFEQQGVPLEENESISPDDHDLNGFKPATYCFGPDKDIILIYIFDSFVQREEISFDNTHFKDNPYLPLDPKPYFANNALLVYLPSQKLESEAEIKEFLKDEAKFKNFLKNRGIFSEVVFYDLNESKERVFKGESANWEGTFTLDYYEHWFKDNAGKLHYEGDALIHPVFKYKSSDIDNVGQITIEYQTPFENGEIKGKRLNKEGDLDIGIEKGHIVPENAVINYSIHWDAKSEELVLTHQE